MKTYQRISLWCLRINKFLTVAFSIIAYILIHVIMKDHIYSLYIMVPYLRCCYDTIKLYILWRTSVYCLKLINIISIRIRCFVSLLSLFWKKGMPDSSRDHRNHWIFISFSNKVFPFPICSSHWQINQSC